MDIDLEATESPSIVPEDKGLYELDTVQQLMTLKHIENIPCLIIYVKNFLSKLQDLETNLSKQKALTYLLLDFDKCEDLTDDEISKIITSSISSVPLLTKLDIDIIPTPNSNFTWLDDLSSNLKQTQIEHFGLIFSEKTEIPKELFSTFSQKFAQINKIPSISLHFPHSHSITDPRLSALSEHAQNFSHNLTHFTLKIPASAITDKGLDYLKSLIVQLSSLIRLDLVISDSYHITNEGLKSLKEAFELMPKLKGILVSLEGCENINYEGIGYIAEGLKSIKELKELDLNLTSCEVDYEGLKSLKNMLFAINELKRLRLKLEFCAGVTEEDINELTEGLLSCSKLSCLELDFSGCSNFSDVCLKRIAEVLQVFEKIHTFAVNFSETGIKDEGFGKFSEGLGKLKTLRYLSIDVFETEMTDKAFETLCKNLKNLNLESLYLNFAQTKLTDDGLAFLKDGVKDSKLKHFSLVAEDCPELSDNGLKEIQSALLQQEKLESLHINFNSDPKIGNTGLISLCEGMRHMSDLEKLTLSFYNCLITDEGIKKMKDLIKERSKIQNLFLSFVDCDGITDHSLNYLKQMLKNMKGLKYVDLSLIDCPQVSVKKLVGFLNHLSYLSFCPSDV